MQKKHVGNTSSLPYIKHLKLRICKHILYMSGENLDSNDKHEKFENDRSIGLKVKAKKSSKTIHKHSLKE